MTPSSFTLDAVNQVFRDVYAKIKVLGSGSDNIDLSQRRIINAHDSIDPFDYVTRNELNRVTKSVNDALNPTGGPLKNQGPIRSGIFTTRGSAVLHPHELFYATDQNYVGWESDGQAWHYVSGKNHIAQSLISALSALLTVNDFGYALGVTNFGHTLVWTGSGWDFSEGDDGSGYIQSFLIAPVGGVWGICDGSTYTYLKADGTTGSQATPDYSTAAYLKLGTSATAGPTAASGNTPTGTVSAPTFTGNSVTTSAPSATATVDNNGGTTTTVASATHTHTDTATGTVSQPTFTGAAMSSLELRRTQLIGYFRR